MSDLIRSGDIVIGMRSGAIFSTGKSPMQAIIDSPTGYSAPLGTESQTYQDIAMWGNNNLLPQQMLIDIEQTGILKSAIDLKARITIGKGPTPAIVTGLDKDGNEELQFIQDGEILDWLEMNNAFRNKFDSALDLFATGQGFDQLLLNNARDYIVGFRRHDAAECRFSKRDPQTRTSRFVYISGDWSVYNSSQNKDDIHFDKIPLLDKDYPLQDLQSRTEGYSFMIAKQYTLQGRQYYAPSPWYAAQKWVKIVQGIPEMKAAMFKNQITIKYLIEVHDKYWERLNPLYLSFDPEKKKEVQENFYKQVQGLLVGGENAYKSLISTMIDIPGVKEPVPALKITAIDDKISEGKLLPDAAAGNSEVLFVMLINPALVGLDIPGGGVRTAGSGSNIREALLANILLHETERRIISRTFDVVKVFNGWSKRYPGLVLRYPSQILTTLNTGANSAGIA